MNDKHDLVRSKYNEIFTQYEKDIIEDCIRLNTTKQVVTLLSQVGSGIDTPEKEMILDAYLALRSTDTKMFESAVRKEMKGIQINSPEEEQEWQRKLDEEAAKFRSIRAEKVDKVVNDISEVEERKAMNDLYEKARKEVKEELKMEEQITEPIEETQEIIEEVFVPKTSEDYRKELDKLGIAYKTNTSKPELVKLYEEATSQNSHSNEKIESEVPETEQS